MKRQLLILASLAAIAFATWADKQVVAKAFFPAVVSAHGGGGAPPPATSYSNPQGSPTITTNITPSSGAVANLLDGNTATGFKMGSSIDRLRYIRFDWGAGNERCIDGIKIYTDAPNTTTTDGWKVAATNDLITYADLDDFTLGGALNGYTENTFTNTHGFRYYILWQKPGSGSTTTPLYAEILFKIDTAAAYTMPTNIPTYAWKYGFLDRQSFISITTTSTTGGGTLSNLVDGEATDDASGSWWFGGGQTGRVMRFDFGAAVKLNEVMFWQDNTTAQGTWQPAYSDDDSIFTNFGSPVTWGGAAISTGDLSAMAAAHRYLRLTQVTGTTSSSPFQRCILFKGSLT